MFSINHFAVQCEYFQMSTKYAPEQKKMAIYEIEQLDIR